MSSIRELLFGPRAFYNDPEYREKTTQTLLDPKLSDVVFDSGLTEETPNSSFWHRLGKKCLSPVNALILPAIKQHSPCLVETIIKILACGKKYLRLTLRGFDLEIDAVIFGKFKTRRFLLYACGNGEYWEGKITDSYLEKLADSCNCNIIIFNYPGVGCSKGPANGANAVKAYKIALALLREIATEWILYGFSIGGGVQTKAIAEEKRAQKSFKPLVVVNDHTFSDLRELITSLTFPLAAKVAANQGWSLSPSRDYDPDHLEIILQTSSATDISPGSILHDGVIPPEDSYAMSVLKRDALEDTKRLIGVSERHCERNPQAPTFQTLCSCIKTMLQNQRRAAADAAGPADDASPSFLSTILKGLAMFFS